MRFRVLLQLAAVCAALGCTSPRELDSVRFSCLGDSECAAGFACRAGECAASPSQGPDPLAQAPSVEDGGGGGVADPADGGAPGGEGLPETGRANGVTCGAASQCGSHFCVDGVCCSSSCAGPCEVCNRVIALGTCTPLPPGSLGRTSCGAYVCAGQSSCPTSCSAAAQCASGRICDSGACVAALPKLSTLQDDFNDNQLTSSRWVRVEDRASLNEQSGLLTYVSTTAANTAGYTSAARYDATGSFAKVQVLNMGNQGLASLVFFLSVAKDLDNELQLRVQQGSWRAALKVGGSTTVLGSGAFALAEHAYLRIRESGGTVYFEGSPDGVTFNAALAAAPAPFQVSSVFARLFARCDAAESSTTTVIFDNFNLP